MPQSGPSVSKENQFQIIVEMIDPQQSTSSLSNTYEASLCTVCRWIGIKVFANWSVRSPDLALFFGFCIAYCFNT